MSRDLHALQRQFDAEAETIEAGKRAFFPERTQERADAFEWAMRIYMIALTFGGIGYGIWRAM